MQYFRGKHGEHITLKDIKKKHTLRADLSAQSMQDEHLIQRYKISHRYASAIGHGEKLLEYIEPTHDKTKLLLRVNPSLSKYIPFYLGEAMLLLFLSMKRLNELLKMGKDIPIENIEKELGTFFKEHYAKFVEEL